MVGPPSGLMSKYGVDNLDSVSYSNIIQYCGNIVSMLYTCYGNVVIILYRLAVIGEEATKRRREGGG